MRVVNGDMKVSKFFKIDEFFEEQKDIEYNAILLKRFPSEEEKEVAKRKCLKDLADWKRDIITIADAASSSGMTWEDKKLKKMKKIPELNPPMIKTFKFFVTPNREIELRDTMIEVKFWKEKEKSNVILI